MHLFSSACVRVWERVSVRLYLRVCCWGGRGCVSSKAKAAASKRMVEGLLYGHNACCHHRADLCKSANFDIPYAQKYIPNVMLICPLAHRVPSPLIPLHAPRLYHNGWQLVR